ncbi:uncharacterized protein LOC127865079 [Dreissena polymorpha]|uniref:Uncharacterized protein n=1 Tax=Dreissena polymorpha TaxID=45954 RepID=A0A9D4MRX8_DREPO|nr:uncharacterized protein LOC127865079 [Dreissena polymorpha]KAH3880849.1 hypothetical protein DPMN_004771 [Dreissena polymorpha]
MNWMGGARNRVKFHDEKKAQQEFFDRQRLKTLTDHSKSQKKKHSQDLLALHTVGRVHSPFPVKQQNAKSIRKLDLEKFISCTRQIEDVDLGPCPPNTKSSKILLNEVTNGHLNSSQKNKAHDSLIQTFGSDEQKTWHKHLDKKGTVTVVNKSEKAATNKKLFLNSTQPFQFSKPKSTAECKQKLLVFEDFTTTPLVHYQQKKTVGEQAFKRHKSHHRDLPGYKNGQIELMRGPFQESVQGSHSTSTPISLPHQPLSFDRMKHFSTTEYLSPIKKESTVSESDFIFKPRPMFSEMQDNVSHNSAGSQPFTPVPFEDPYGRSKPFYATKIDINDDKKLKNSLMEDLYKTPKMSRSNLMDRRKSHTSSMSSKSTSSFSSAYEKSDTAASEFDVQHRAIMQPEGRFSSLTKHSQKTLSENKTERLPILESEKNSSIPDSLDSRKSHTSSMCSKSTSSFTAAYEQPDSASKGFDVQHRAIIQPGGGFSSLTKYRLNMLSENDTARQQMIESELNSSISENSFFKPSFTGNDEDFQYRPSKGQNSSADRSAELKNTSYKSELNSSISETSFYKPSFTGIEGDFEYRPSKRQNSRTDGSAELKNTSYKRSLNINKGQERSLKRSNGLSSESFPSPKNADVFPKHCEIQIEPQGSTSEANCTDAEMVNSSDLCNYKPHQERSENIIDEIKQLDEQDRDSQDKSQTIIMSSLLPKDGKCSESFEAEVYLDSEHKLMEEDIKYYNNHVAKPPVTEEGNAAFQPKRPSSYGSSHGEYSSSVSPVFDPEKEIGIPGDENEKTLKTFIESKKNTNVNVKETSYISQPLQHLHKYSKVERHLQDPEISSGKTQYTQTESCHTMFNDVATSPLLPAGPSQHHSGTQCDLYQEVFKVPSLKKIAGNCFATNLIQSNKSANDPRVCENEP